MKSSTWLNWLSGLLLMWSVVATGEQLNPNKLSKCPSGSPEHWSSCFGLYESGGSSFIGEFKNGEMHGFGTMYYFDGSIFTGSWQKGNWHGEGIFRSPKGTIYQGTFRQNELFDEHKVDLALPSPGLTIDQFRSGLEEKAEKTSRSNLAKRQIVRNDTNSSEKLSMTISTTTPNSEGILTIAIQTNADTASLKINGEEQGGRADGNYSIKKVARVGQDTQFTITAVDINGNSDTKTITVTRQAAPAADTSIALKPEAIKRAPARDAVAIIIGIQDYKRVPKAEFANNDAKEFYEYAIRALGIKQEKIKMLLDDDADEVNIVKAFENWLPIQVNKDKTDVYVFYSGHGLPAPDGKSLYFLPHGVDKELLSRTAVGQNEIVAALSAAKPKSVTMFIDACYSGQTRGGDVLIANAKPVSLKSGNNAYPPNFTVITASANDQISSSSPALKHGIFSFYLMKGMEGEADTNKDGKITMGEMQDYLSDRVSRQAMTLNRKQTTQLVGDASRVLVGR